LTRISDNQRFLSTQDRMSKARIAADKVQEQAVSGRKLHRVSDDPVAVVRSLRNRTQLSNLDQFRKTIDFARGFLSISEDALRSMNESIIRAKELAVQQANATYDPASRQTVSREIRQIEEHLIALGNSTYNDRFVFGGFQTFRAPISPDGHYLGDDGVIFIQTDQDTFKPINIPGRSIFGGETEQGIERVPLLVTISELAQGLEDNNLDLVHQKMVELDQASENIINTLATLGLRATAVEDVANRLDFKEERLQKDSQNLEGVDPARTALDLKRASSSLEYTLNSSSRILAPTLMNYLK
jgi:flagellar hook-associated protein 3 FlgL